MLIDSHCHIPHKKYGVPPGDIVRDAENSGVSKLISIGTSMKEAELVINTAAEFPNVFPTVGIYPHEDRGRDLEVLESEFRSILNDCGDIIGIGECGIDISNWKNGRPINEQIKIFEMQIILAKESSLPLVIHNRNGDEYVLNLLKKYSNPSLRGVIHCFDSDWSFAEKVLDLGFYISFSGLITYPKKGYLLDVVREVPMDRFLVETDSPYLPPQGFRGQVNLPKYVRIVAEKVAEFKGLGVQEIEESSYKNTCSLFCI